MAENSDISENSIRGEYVHCLSQQLSELELLQSMYPNQNEITLTDINTLESIKEFLNSMSEYIPNYLDYTVKLTSNMFKMDISVNLPTLYPKDEPDIYVRCNQLNRQQERILNLELMQYIKENFIGDVCLYNALSWLQDNIEIYANKYNDEKSPQKTKEKLHEVKFVRLWVYSHHIYNKKKIEYIFKMAKDLNLTGFCLIGKPGIICVEGSDNDCIEWWKDIKALSWKKIEIRMTDTYDLSEQPQKQKFTTFKELNFSMSEFGKYLEEHGLGQYFIDLFKLCTLML